MWSTRCCTSNSTSYNLYISVRYHFVMSKLKPLSAALSTRTPLIYMMRRRIRQRTWSPRKNPIEAVVAPECVTRINVRKRPFGKLWPPPQPMGTERSSNASSLTPLWVYMGTWNRVACRHNTRPWKGRHTKLWFEKYQKSHRGIHQKIFYWCSSKHKLWNSDESFIIYLPPASAVKSSNVTSSAPFYFSSVPKETMNPSGLCCTCVWHIRLFRVLQSPSHKVSLIYLTDVSSSVLRRWSSRTYK